jgi:divalent metal cation (Fe/Co/Zn/Cd) transporter
VVLLSALTIAWLAIDGVIAIWLGLAAASWALLGWGLDCAIQAAGNGAIVWRFTGTRAESPNAERLAQRAVAVSYLVLAPYLVGAAAWQLFSGGAPQASWLGVALAATDALAMPLLGRAKRRLGIALESSATTSAGNQNILCAYLSVAVLIGLLANATLSVWWADPLVAVVVAAACLHNGLRALSGTDC